MTDNFPLYALVCRPQTAATAVPLVPSKPFGAARAGAPSAKLFQPAPPAAAETAARAVTPGQNGNNASANYTNCGAFEDFPAVSAAGHTAHGAGPTARLNNPYTQVLGRGMQAGAAQRGVTKQPQNAFSSALQEQQTADMGSRAEAAVMPMEPAADQDAGAIQQVAAAQLHAERTQDLITTYSSFSHDPVYPYAAFGAGPAISYAEPSELTDPVDFPSDVRTHAEPHEDTAQVSSNF
ncbi:hypothetical protein ABBQ38_007632 [Trebouxia sp. C0009 RCD-2024]